MPLQALHKLLLATVCLAFAACASTATPTPSPLVNVPLTLDIGKSATLRPGLSISFDGVRDSRCPQKAHCVWAGELVYLLTLHEKTDEALTLSMKSPQFTSRSGVSVALNTEQAPPLPILGQPPPKYTVMLLINSN